MLITRLGGITAPADTALDQADKIECLYQAGGAIGTNLVVMHDISDTSGKKVVVGNDTNDHRACGVYEGFGGTGAVTAVVDGTGKSAVTGDIIRVTTYGPARCQLAATVVAGRDCMVDANGRLQQAGTQILAGHISPFMSYEAHNATDAQLIHVKCM